MRPGDDDSFVTVGSVMIAAITVILLVVALAVWYIRRKRTEAREMMKGDENRDAEGDNSTNSEQLELLEKQVKVSLILHHFA